MRAMEKEEQASLMHDLGLGKESGMRTKRASGFRSVFFHRSTWAVSPVSLPPAIWCSGIGSPPWTPPRNPFRSDQHDIPLQRPPTAADTSCRLRAPTA